MTQNIGKFLDKFQTESYDIRTTHDARYVDQKCTPDVVCFIADCILSTSCANKSFIVNDLWAERFFVENCRVIFGKPSPEDPNAKNEYNKILSQPLKLLAYAHVLGVSQEKKTLVFHVQDRGMLEFISIRERNAYNFMYAFFMKVAEASGIMRYFDEYRENYKVDARAARSEIYEKYHRFISANTPSRSKLDVYRMFHKVFNLYAFHEVLPGSTGSLLSLGDLMYNKINMRDKKTKQKYCTRAEALKQERRQLNEQFYVDYQVSKAIRMVRKMQGRVSEVHDDLDVGAATEVHHIFPKSEYPELATYFENLILLTSSQHRQKAHPNGNFHIVDRDYQMVCLMAKSQTIERYIQEFGETFYTKRAFAYVVTQGLQIENLDAQSSFFDIQRRILGAYNGYDAPDYKRGIMVAEDGA